jgi:hypothetical protein
VFNIADTTAGTTFIALCRTVTAMTPAGTTIVLQNVQCDAPRAGRGFRKTWAAVLVEQIYCNKSTSYLHVKDRHTMRVS